MDVAAAFPRVARGFLLQKMRNMELDENLVRWTDSSMRDRKVIMSVDGQGGEALDVTTGLPQGSPISPALFAIYIADIHQAVENEVDGMRSRGTQTSKSCPGFGLGQNGRGGLMCSGPTADPGHPRMGRAIRGWPGVRGWPGLPH